MPVVHFSFSYTDLFVSYIVGQPTYIRSVVQASSYRRRRRGIFAPVSNGLVTAVTTIGNRDLGNHIFLSVAWRA